MKNIIIIDGTSSIWKNDLLTYINEQLPNSFVVEKISTRKKRADDKRVDLVFTQDENLSHYNLDYIYRFDGEEYGFSKSQIETALSSYTNIFIVVRNQDIIRTLQKDFRNYNIFKVFIYSEMSRIIEVLSLSTDSFLKESIEKAEEDYLRTPDIYDLVVINGKNKSDFFRLIDHILFRTIQHRNFLTRRFSKNTKYTVNILFPLIYSAILGLAINIFSNKEFSVWPIMTMVLSTVLSVILVCIHLYIGKSGGGDIDDQD